MPDSKRERILSAMEAVFRTAVGPGGTVFNRIMDTPYDRDEHKGQNILSILEGNESYIELLSPDKLDRSMEVELVCRAYVPMGTPIRAGANIVLADMEAVIVANERWNGEAYATLFQSNAMVREDTVQRAVEVSIFVFVRYRTKRTDPFSGG